MENRTDTSIKYTMLKAMLRYTKPCYTTPGCAVLCYVVCYTT